MFVNAIKKSIPCCCLPSLRFCSKCFAPETATPASQILIYAGPRNAGSAVFLNTYRACPTRRPMAAVEPIAMAPQKVTRNIGLHMPPPPVRAPIAPRIASATSEPADTNHEIRVDGEAKTIIKGMAAPTAKVTADVNAACTGRATICADRPNSSRACVANASRAVSASATWRASEMSSPRST